MRKICVILAALLILTLLGGCNILKSDNPPELPKLDLDSSRLTGVVEFINGRTCRITVTEGDSHFDGPHENRKGEMVSGDTIQVTYTSIAGAKTVGTGDTVTFSYRYTQDVSEKNGDPHIAVNELRVGG